MTKEYSFEFVTATAAIQDYVNRIQTRLVSYEEIQSALGVSMPQLKYALNKLVKRGVLKPMDGRGVYARSDWESRQSLCDVSEVKEDIKATFAEELFWEDARRYRAGIGSTRVG